MDDSSQKTTEEKWAEFDKKNDPMKISKVFIAPLLLCFLFFLMLVSYETYQGIESGAMRVSSLIRRASSSDAPAVLGVETVWYVINLLVNISAILLFVGLIVFCIKRLLKKDNKN